MKKEFFLLIFFGFVFLFCAAPDQRACAQTGIPQNFSRLKTTARDLIKENARLRQAIEDVRQALVRMKQRQTEPPGPSETAAPADYDEQKQQVDDLLRNISSLKAEVDWLKKLPADDVPQEAELRKQIASLQESNKELKARIAQLLQRKEDLAP